MHDLHLTIVDAFRFNGVDFDLSRLDNAWSFALDQRAFGPRRLIVVTAGQDGQVLGLAYCEGTEPPEAGLICCLDTLDDGAAAAIAYSDEPVAADPPADLEERFAAARAVAGEVGVHLVDWMMCDDTEFRSMRFTLEEFDDWWDVCTDRRP